LFLSAYELKERVPQLERQLKEEKEHNKTLQNEMKINQKNVTHLGTLLIDQLS
jgi:hypothetical protein